MRIGRAAHDLHNVAAGINAAKLELVGIGMLLGRDDMGDDEIFQHRAAVLERLHFEADIGKRLGDGARIRIGLEMLFEPRQRELHRLNPPSKVGRSSAAKPKCRSQRRSESKNGRRSGAPYFSIAMRSMPK